MRVDDSWWSLDALNAANPDPDHDSTSANLADIFNASAALPCFRKEDFAVAEIQRWQLHDDPREATVLAKIDSIRRAMRAGVSLPAVVLVHTMDGPRYARYRPELSAGPYHLLEGHHRYNAAYREAKLLFAWVAHIGCSGGPRPTSQTPRKRRKQPQGSKVIGREPTSERKHGGSLTRCEPRYT